MKSRAILACIAVGVVIWSCSQFLPGAGLKGDPGSVQPIFEPSGPDDTTRLGIEKAMRDLQIRVYMCRGSYVEWPNCFGCGGAGAFAPPYPPDKFYGKKLSEAQQCMLVQALVSKFWSTAIYLDFI